MHKLPHLLDVFAAVCRNDGHVLVISALSIDAPGAYKVASSRRCMPPPALGGAGRWLCTASERL